MPTFEPLGLKGAYRIILNPIGDNRGNFMETYRARDFAERGLVTDWVQENQSYSAPQGTLRGLHFQLPPYTETKLIRVLQGSILDVLVDLRRDSPTYGQWEAHELSAGHPAMLYIPRGFAHGFCTLVPDVVVSYKVDAYYAPDAQGGILWSDPGLAIEWPCTTPVLSDKDARLPFVTDFESPF